MFGFLHREIHFRNSMWEMVPYAAVGECRTVAVVDPDREHRSGAQSVERALAVLRTLESAPHDVGVSEIAQRTGLTVSTAHRLTRALCDAGLVTQDRHTERYQLGPALVVLGRRAEERLGYTRALPALEELAERTKESVNLGIRSGSEVLVVLDVVSRQPLRFDQAAGTRVAVHTSAMGKCLLAFSREVDAAVRSLPELRPATPRTITDREALRKELQTVGTRGWALNDEERNPGVRAVAGPVLDSAGVAVAAIAVQGPVTRITNERIETLAEEIAGIARQVASLLVATGL
jgi:IclR family acetate operon transcriptional repressor